MNTLGIIFLIIAIIILILTIAYILHRADTKPPPLENIIPVRPLDPINPVRNPSVIPVDGKEYYIKQVTSGRYLNYNDGIVVTLPTNVMRWKYSIQSDNSITLTPFDLTTPMGYFFVDTSVFVGVSPDPPNTTWTLLGGPALGYAIKSKNDPDYSLSMTDQNVSIVELSSNIIDKRNKFQFISIV